MEEKDDEARLPTPEDLIHLCRRLNEQAAKYIVVGGMAILQQGYARMTEDIDLLIDASAENQERVRAAMMFLPDRAVRELQPGDLDTYVVVRIGDEFVVDLMKIACGIDYERAKEQVDWIELDGVRIPFANPRLLWHTKQTFREKDLLDRLFLMEKLGGELPPPIS